jgi:hypothetical protein
MRIRARQNLLAGVMFFGAGAVLVLGSHKYNIGTLDEMGPGFLPLLVGLLLGIVGIVLIGRSLLAREDIVVELHAPPLILVSAAICIFALILPAFGLFAAVAVLAFVASQASRDSRLIDSLLLSLCLAAVSGALFVYGLGLPLALWPKLGL